jgi:hypothetical protein
LRSKRTMLRMETPARAVTSAAAKMSARTTRMM